jgi:hypothetical protein
MKNFVFALLSMCFSLASYAQVGDTFLGLQGGYNSQYKDGMYGLNISHHFLDQAEASFTGLLNPSISLSDTYPEDNLKVYSLSLDLRYYLMLMRSWGMGPVLGYQHLFVQYKEKPWCDFNASGFNIGWHLRGNLTDEIKLMGGWRYTMANKSSEDTKHHYIYLGFGYTFSLY